MNKNDNSSHNISFSEALRVWIKVALLSFGGPAGQIAVMHRLLVEEKKWISESRFMHALNYCMVLPGPEAQQLATYIGWLLHGTKGGLTAGLLFILPGFLSILILSVLYAGFQNLSIVEGLFFGIKTAVLAIVLQAVLKIGKKALKTTSMLAIACTAFIAIFIFNIPFPLIIIAAAAIGYAGGKIKPEQFVVIKAHGSDKNGVIDDHLDKTTQDKPALRQTLKTVLIWLCLWLVPLLSLVLFLGPDDVFTQIALFFSKLAVVTFGGAYAVLAYMAQEAVQNYGWLAPGEMLDGLGMAETTPGPLIQIVQFVGFMGAFRDSGLLNPYMAGFLASVLATWMTFIPCFLWIFAGAPYIERLRGNSLIGAALSGITAAVTGVILNLAIWFSMHVLFENVSETKVAGLDISLPDIATLNISAFILFLMSLLLIFRLKIGMIPTIIITAFCGVILHYFPVLWPFT